MNKITLLFALFLMQLMLFGCGQTREENLSKQLNEAARITERSLKRLKDHIDAGHIANTQTLKMYARKVKEIKPEFSELIDAIARDATSNGPIYQALTLRLSDALADVSIASKQGGEQYTLLNKELYALQNASKTNLYGKMLADPINVLSDMSDGTLPRVDALSKKAEEAVDGTGAESASQLVGNPNYGSWQQNSSGQSLWAWYGQYALFSRLLGGPVYYDRWGSRRGYSYYHDYGRKTYSSPSQIKTQDNVAAKTRDKFAKEGRKFQSPYQKKRATSSVISSARKPKDASSSYKSPYSKPRTSSSNKSTYKSSYSTSTTTSGFRSSRFQSSRSSFGGK